MRCIAVSMTLVVSLLCPSLIAPALARGPAAHALPPTVMNFRDVGGTALPGGRCVRPHVVFRSGNFDATTPEDSAALAGEFGLKTYFDLRAPTEGQGAKGPAGLSKAGVQWRPLPMDSHDDPMLQVKRPTKEQWAAFYVRSFERHSAVYVQLLTQIAAATSPVVYGCTLGKDRTGMSTALLLALLGASDDAISRDYLLTNGPLQAHAEQMRERYESWGLTTEDYLVGYATVYPEVLAQFLAHLRKTYGSVDKALLSKGLTQESLTALRKRLLASGEACRN